MPNKKNIKDEPKSNTKSVIIFFTVALLIIVGAIAFAISFESTKEERAIRKELKGVDKITVSIDTGKGEMIAELRADLMPITVSNFVRLINDKFYDGLTFHRVEDWVIQGGDPNADGSGGPGWNIKLETHKDLKNVKYAIAMARSDDPDSAGSQFYILKQDAPQLDGQYAVFGNIIKGQDVVDKIEIGDWIKSITIVE